MIVLQVQDQQLRAQGARRYPCIEGIQGILIFAADLVKDMTTQIILKEYQVHFTAVNVRLSFFVIVGIILTKWMLALYNPLLNFHW